VIAGLTAGIGGVVLAGRTGASSPLYGSLLELDTIAAVIIGGASFLGGRGQDVVNAIAVDSVSNAHVVGQTGSPDFATVNAAQTAYGRPGGGDHRAIRVRRQECGRGGRRGEASRGRGLDHLQERRLHSGPSGDARGRRDWQSFNAAAGAGALADDSHQPGNEGWTELFGFRGYGERPATGALAEGVSGTYATDYNDFHVRQQGTALVGCYEYDFGVLDGAIEGRVMKITWREQEDGSERGPAVMVFSPDGTTFRGFWWRSGNELKLPDGEWNGTKKSAAVGSCPHWSGSISGELTKTLLSTGRARVYGILFDLDLATIRPASKPVLDEVAASLESQPDWRLTIEGHTDSTGSTEHNRVLAQSRRLVKAYLVAAGSTPRACRPRLRASQRWPTTRPSSVEPEPPGRAGARKLRPGSRRQAFRLDIEGRIAARPQGGRRRAACQLPASSRASAS
jgi:hypothetical protein